MYIICPAYLVTGDVASLKDQSFTIKEGASYQLKMNFCVQREIVTGLKLVLKTTRAGIKGLFIKLITSLLLVQN